MHFHMFSMNMCILYINILIVFGAVPIQLGIICDICLGLDIAAFSVDLHEFVDY